MSDGLKALRCGDAAGVLDFCEQDPITNLSLISRMTQYPIGTAGVHAAGYVKGGQLQALCYLAGSLLVAGSDPVAMDAFAIRFGRVRTGSVMGESSGVLEMHRRLVEHWGGYWSRPRNIRARQPLMLWRGSSPVAPDPAVRRLDVADFPSYFDASVQMYTEEIGSSPLEAGPGYDQTVLARLSAGLAFGVVDNGRVLFKADLGIVHGDRAQIQGVWLDPALRGRGLAAPAMTSVVSLAAHRFSSISLYVNDFNIPAVRTYQRCGFERVGTLATIHY